NASLPVLGWLAVLSLACAAACVVQMFQAGWRFLVAGIMVLILFWVLGLGVYPALLQRFRVTPNELEAERPFIQHNIRMTREAYMLDRVAEKDFAAEASLDTKALERNSLTIKNIRLWDHRPLLTTYGKLQEIRTYYKFLDVDVDRYTVNGEYRQVMLSGRELSYRDLPSRGFINETLTSTHGNGQGAGPGEPDQRGGLAGVLPEGHPADRNRLTEGHAARDLLWRARQRLRLRAHALAGARLSVGRSERLRALSGPGRHSGALAGGEGRLRASLRRAEGLALGRPDRREPRYDLP